MEDPDLYLTLLVKNVLFKITSNRNAYFLIKYKFIIVK